MKVTLKPHAELDVLTRDELRAELEAIIDRLHAQPADVRLEEDGRTDAGGELELPFYRVPMGMCFRLTRCYVVADGFNPAVPFNGAGAFLELLRAGVPVTGVSLVAAAANGGQLPFLLVDADSPPSAPVYFNGEEVALRLTNGPASTGVGVRAQGTLEPVVRGN